MVKKNWEKSPPYGRRRVSFEWSHKWGRGGGGYLCFAMSTVFLMDRLFESDKLFYINFHFFDISPNLLLPKVNWAISISELETPCVFPTPSNIPSPPSPISPPPYSHLINNSTTSIWKVLLKNSCIIMNSNSTSTLVGVRKSQVWIQVKHTWWC